MCIILLPACRQIHIDREFSGLKNKAKFMLDEPIEHGNPHAYTLHEIASIDTAGGLSRDNAVSIALFNNPFLHAEFENLGIAKADLVQAGLFTNPCIDGIFGIPSNDDPLNQAKSLIDVYATMRLSDLWIVPLSKHVAQDVLEITSLNILSRILDTVVDTKNAYDYCLFTDLKRNNAAEILEWTKKLRQEILYQQNYGYTTDLDIYNIDSKLVDLESEVLEFEKNNNLALVRLKELMGLDPSSDALVLTGRLTITDSIPPFEVIQEYALTNRPEMLIARMKVEQYKDTIRVEKAKIFKNVNAGISFQQDFGQTRGWGPVFIMDIPIFDSNYAQIAKAEFLHAQALENLTATEIKIKAELSAAYATFSALQEQIHMFEQKALPAAEKAIDYAYVHLETMQLNAITALETNVSYFELNHKLIDLRAKALQELVKLERAVGKKLILINKTMQAQEIPH